MFYYVWKSQTTEILVLVEILEKAKTLKQFHCQTFYYEDMVQTVVFFPMLTMIISSFNTQHHCIYICPPSFFFGKLVCLLCVEKSFIQLNSKEDFNSMVDVGLAPYHWCSRCRSAGDQAPHTKYWAACTVHCR